MRLAKIGIHRQYEHQLQYITGTYVDHFRTSQTTWAALAFGRKCLLVGADPAGFAVDFVVAAERFARNLQRDHLLAAID